MNKDLKEFLHRGLIFSGFGPVVLGIVFLILHFASGITLTGKEVFVGILSTYLLAFVHAGVSIFPQKEEWSVPKVMAVHLSLLYVTYLVCYLINSWLEFSWVAIFIFTAVFIVIYLVIWLIVLLITKKTTKNLNSKL